MVIQIRNTFLAILFGLLIFSFAGVQAQVVSESAKELAAKIGKQREAYQFFVAGHAYGNPDSAENYKGVYPPFYAMWPWLSEEGMAFGAFAGDIVPHNDPQHWDELEADLAELPFPKHFVPGNHDLQAGVMYDEFDKRMGARYHSFRHENDLFLFIDTETNHWRIPDAQLNWIEGEMMRAPEAKNIFIVMHNVVWWEEDTLSRFHYPTPNSLYNRLPSNFHSDLMPRLQRASQNVYCFAGDTGRNCNGKALTYWNEANVHLITTGMGCATESNFVLVKVKKSGKVELEVKWLDGVDGGGLKDHRF